MSGFGPSIWDLMNSYRNMRSRDKITNLETINTVQTQRTAKLSAKVKDLDTVALVLASVVEKLVAKGLISREELLGQIHELDFFDGNSDGKLDVGSMKTVMGYDAPEAQNPPFPNKPVKVRKKPKWREK